MMRCCMNAGLGTPAILASFDAMEAAVSIFLGAFKTMTLARYAPPCSCHLLAYTGAYCLPALRAQCACDHQLFTTCSADAFRSTYNSTCKHVIEARHAVVTTLHRTEELAIHLGYLVDAAHSRSSWLRGCAVRIYCLHNNHPRCQSVCSTLRLCCRLLFHKCIHSTAVKPAALLLNHVLGQLWVEDLEGVKGGIIISTWRQPFNVVFIASFPCLVPLHAGSAQSMLQELLEEEEAKADAEKASVALL